jgi:hypothetical protein
MFQTNILSPSSTVQATLQPFLLLIHFCTLRHLKDMLVSPMQLVLAKVWTEVPNKAHIPLTTVYYCHLLVLFLTITTDSPCVDKQPQPTVLDTWPEKVTRTFQRTIKPAEAVRNKLQVTVERRSSSVSGWQLDWAHVTYSKHRLKTKPRLMTFCQLIL